MARTLKRNPYEMQAKLSLLLAVIGSLSALALVYCVFRRFTLEPFAAQYLEGSPRFYVIIGSAAVGAVASGIGFFVGWNSAGQRRNPLSNLAWTAFFLNAAVLLVTLCTFALFWLAKDPVYRVTG